MGFTPSQIIKSRREAAGISIDELSTRSGISIPNLHDLESNENDIYVAISLKELADLCRILGTSSSGLFSQGEKGGKHLTPADIAMALRKFLISHDASISQFGDEVGWNLEGFLDNPNLAWKWNVDCLRDVTSKIGVPLIDALPD